MNQILQVEEKKYKNSNPIDTKKIVLFFAVSIIIFGLILLGEGIYSIYKTNSIKKIRENTNNNVEENIPTIQFAKTADNKIIINIKSEIAINHIIYNWNNETSQTIDESGKTDIEEVIDMPSGENTLNISVIDVNGKETKKQETYNVEQDRPTIELSVVGNDIKITVKSSVEISYVSYKWNSDPEKKENMATFEDKTKYEKTLEIPTGQNTLKIVAVDINQKTTEKSQEIKGIVKPEKPKTVIKGEYMEFTAQADENIQTVEFIFNGASYIMNTDTFGQTKVVKYRVKMKEGWNYLKITATTKSGGSESSIWSYEYKK